MVNLGINVSMLPSCRSDGKRPLLLHIDAESALLVPSSSRSCRLRRACL